MSARIAPYQVAFNIVREYFTAKGPAAMEKYFWKNSSQAAAFARNSSRSNRAHAGGAIGVSILIDGSAPSAATAAYSRGSGTGVAVT